jgi:hypothetical protein
MPPMNVRAWLNELGVGHYADAFDEAGIDGEGLRALTAGDLAALGVTAFSHRKKILRAISELKSGQRDIRLPADELPP